MSLKPVVGAVLLTFQKCLEPVKNISLGGSHKVLNIKWNIICLIWYLITLPFLEISIQHSEGWETYPHWGINT